MLPLPPHWNPDRVGEVWRVDYAARFEDAERWRARARDRAGGRRPLPDRPRRRRHAEHVLLARLRALRRRPLGDGRARRLAPALRVRLPQPRRAHPDRADARHPPGAADLPPRAARRRRGAPSGAVHARHRRRRRGGPLADQSGRRAGLGLDPDYAEEHLRYYTRTLEEGGKYNLTIWPFHAMLGGIGHALVSALEEALFFHSIARYAPLDFQPKGDNPLTEHYSMLGPEVEDDLEGEPLGRAQPAADRAPAPVRRGRDRRPGEEPLRRLDDRGPALRPERAGARPRGEGLPARGLHLVGRRPRLRRLHRRGRRGTSRASPSRARTSSAPTSRCRVARRRRRVARAASSTSSSRAFGR